LSFQHGHLLLLGPRYRLSHNVKEDGYSCTDDKRVMGRYM
jgi:hypothetical protein